jgi:hypothetical protein
VTVDARWCGFLFPVMSGDAHLEPAARRRRRQHRHERLWTSASIEQHDVSMPSLTGVGERIHLSGPLVGLGTHIRDVVNHVLYEDLDEIV